MKGLELCEKYYKTFGEKILKEKFPDLFGKIAVGVFGSGSECYGFDDEISRDHDFEPSFTIILPSEEEVGRKEEFSLEREYAKLPKEFLGFKRQNVNPVGGNRRGVVRAEDFFMRTVGRADGLLSGEEWFSVPEHFLSEATNGKIFHDGNGVFTSVRDYLASYPKDVLLKKLAGNILLAAQAGQYNYPRSVARGDLGGAQLSAIEFTKAAMNCLFLLAGVYAPYYKWKFRALSEFTPKETVNDLLFLISSDNFAENTAKKIGIIEKICASLANSAKEKGFCGEAFADAEKLAFAVNDGISDAVLRTKNILYAV